MVIFLSRGVNKMIGKLEKKIGGYTFHTIHKGKKTPSGRWFKTIDEAYAAFHETLRRGEMNKAPGQHLLPL